MKELIEGTLRFLLEYLPRMEPAAPSKAAKKEHHVLSLCWAEYIVVAEKDRKRISFRNLRTLSLRNIHCPN